MGYYGLGTIFTVMYKMQTNFVATSKQREMCNYDNDDYAPYVINNKFSKWRFDDTVCHMLYTWEQPAIHGHLESHVRHLTWRCRSDWWRSTTTNACTPSVTFSFLLVNQFCIAATQVYVLDIRKDRGTQCVVIYYLMSGRSGNNIIDEVRWGLQPNQQQPTRLLAMEPHVREPGETPGRWEWRARDSGHVIVSENTGDDINQKPVPDIQKNDRTAIVTERYWERDNNASTYYDK